MKSETTISNLPKAEMSPPQQTLPTHLTISLDRFQIYREEDKHECNLLSARVNALLTSQSLLVAAAAVLYSVFHQNLNQNKSLLMLVIIIGLITTGLSSIAIYAGTSVLRGWHKQHTALINADENYAKEIEGCYLKKRGTMPDWRHNFSIEFFGIGLSLVYLVFWFVVGVGFLLKS